MADLDLPKLEPGQYWYIGKPGQWGLFDVMLMEEREVKRLFGGTKRKDVALCSRFGSTSQPEFARNPEWYIREVCRWTLEAHRESVSRQQAIEGDYWGVHQ